MSARRQSSTTSLSKYARANSPDLSDRSLDFCNAFWGLGDGGVDVLFARMRGAMRTIEELRNFWKERASIEEQYAKRLANLAKVTLGRDEIGDLRASLDTLRQETEKQSGFHMMVAQQIKTDLEGQTAIFLSRQQHHKKTFQATIEKDFKTKQTHESYVNKAREKYEADCVRINSYTAQSTLMQGKDLEKIQLKLERAQQTVQANERDFAKFARILQDTAQKWELDWKAFCDSCQDMEEERMEFMKDNMWAFANAVSTVCVADDESCEKLRLSLEQIEPERDMENFVRDYGTGSSIPDPPAFVNYANPEAVPSSSQRPTTHLSNFVRSSQRARQAPPTPVPQDEDEEPTANMAGIGMAGGRRNDTPSDPQLNRARSQSRGRGRPFESSQTNGYSSSPVSAQHARPERSPAAGARVADPQADPIDPTAKTMIKIGENAYEVDLSRDPQARTGPGAVSPVKVGQNDDPLARQMAELQKAAPAKGASMRRSGQWSFQGQSSQGPMSQSPPTSVSPTKRDSAAKLSPPPSGSQDGNRRSSLDYRRSAQMVVGAYPQIPTSRPASPNPPVAAHMQPPSFNSTGPMGNLPVQDVLADYQQSFPGERKSVSRPTSRAGSTVGMPGQPLQSQNQIQRDRPLSIGGQAGIGAQGRSTSPQPFVPLSRSTSPAAPPSQGGAQVSHRNSYQRVPPPSVNGTGPGHAHAPSQSSVRQNSISVPQHPAQQQRAASPNSVGIALDPSGRVAIDSMADVYAQRQQQPQYSQPPLQNPPAPQQPPQQEIQRRPTYTVATSGYAPPPPGQSHAQYGNPSNAIAAPNYGHPYGAPASQQPPNQSMYAVGPPVQYQHQQQQQPQQPQAPVYQPQPHGYSQQGQVVQDLQRGASVNGYYGPQGGYAPHTQQQLSYRAPSPARQPSPQPPAVSHGQPPTGAFTDDGRGILFYVKALYDYQATIDEEFDFQAGDIIAVTATPEDGWWSGELLDEARRQPGRHVFPSNFVCLF